MLKHLRSILVDRALPTHVVALRVWNLKILLAAELHKRNFQMFIRHARNQCPNNFVSQVFAEQHYDDAAAQADNDGVGLLPAGLWPSSWCLTSLPSALRLRLTFPLTINSSLKYPFLSGDYFQFGH